MLLFRCVFIPAPQIWLQYLHSEIKGVQEPGDLSMIVTAELWCSSTPGVCMTLACVLLARLSNPDGSHSDWVRWNCIAILTYTLAKHTEHFFHVFIGHLYLF